MTASKTAQAIVAADGIPALVGLLHIGTDVLRTTAAHTLRCLANENRTIWQATAEAGGVEHLVQLLRSRSEAMQAEAAGALCNLAHTNSDNWQVIVAAAVLRPW